MLILDIDFDTRDNLIKLIERKKKRKTGTLPPFGIKINGEVFYYTKIEDCDDIDLSSTFEFRLLNDEEEWIHLDFDAQGKLRRFGSSSNALFYHPNLRPTVEKIRDAHIQKTNEEE